jgi:hypothetical protein
VDHFERMLTRMLCESEQYTPIEPQHRERLRNGVRARQRARTAWRAGGSALAVAGLAVGLALLPGAFAANEPAVPAPQPTGTPYPSPDGSPRTRSAAPTTSERGAAPSSRGSGSPTDTSSSPVSGTAAMPGSYGTSGDVYGGRPDRDGHGYTDDAADREPRAERNPHPLTHGHPNTRTP